MNTAITLAAHGASFEAVTQLLARYFDGLYHGDAALLAEVLHPQAHYITASDGTLLHRDMASYLPIVAARASPARQGHVRTDRIVGITFAGPVTALAQVECSLPDRDFIDLLSLVRLEGRWWIVGKVFHHTMR